MRGPWRQPLVNVANGSSLAGMAVGGAQRRAQLRQEVGSRSLHHGKQNVRGAAFPAHASQLLTSVC
jgi:hypothetical protein